MSEGKIYVGDTPQLRVDTGIDLTSVSTKKLKVLKPSGVKVEWSTGVGVTSTPTDGILTYQCNVGDLSASGIYKVQAYVTFESGGKTFTGETAQFKVYNNWE